MEITIYSHYYGIDKWIKIYCLYWKHAFLELIDESWELDQLEYIVFSSSGKTVIKMVFLHAKLAFRTSLAYVDKQPANPRSPSSRLTFIALFAITRLQ